MLTVSVGCRLDTWLTAILINGGSGLRSARYSMIRTLVSEESQSRTRTNTVIRVPSAQSGHDSLGAISDGVTWCGQATFHLFTISHFAWNHKV